MEVAGGARERPELLDFARSMLFVPALDERKWHGALGGAADALILDLEDSIAPDHKDRARDSVPKALRERTHERPLALIRVNDLTTPWAKADLDVAESSGAEGIVIPKADAASLASLPADGLPVAAIIETAKGLRTIHDVADHPRVQMLLLGGADLAAELGLEYRPDGLELLMARSQLVVASAAAGLRAPIDVVHMSVSAEEALREESRLARSLGFAGKLCIHPRQVAAVNEEFSPNASEITASAEIVAAFERATEEGSAVTVLNGRMIDLPVVLRARRTLESAAALPSDSTVALT